MTRDLNRRVFLERLGACALGGAALSQGLGPRAEAQSSAYHSGNAAAWRAPQVLTNPNILIIVVDQMRWPCWLTPNQMSTLSQVYLPNICGRIQNNSYCFQQYFTVSTACVPARASLLTGLYSPQTAIYTNNGPPLNTTYPTWSKALTALNPAYQNVWWFGKWHVSDTVGIQNPLLPYGFQTGMYPGGQANNAVTGKSYYIPSPDGAANEGLNGGVNHAAGPQDGEIFASDQMIAGDFINWLQGKSPLYPAPPVPAWCATVSLINPHDIAKAPGWFNSTLPPSGLPAQPVYFPSDFPNGAPAGSPPALLGAQPSPWNLENLLNKSGPNYVGNKPSFQYAFVKGQNHQLGQVTDWVAFLNQYYWLQNLVDVQVGRVLDALSASPYAANTVVVFTSDHGEYGGSHGLHDKSGAVYDESLHVPLCIQFPKQTGCTTMNQLCSSVDFFGLICDMATGGGQLWKTAYPDLASRQSIWNFLYKNSSETRTVSVGPGLPPVPYTLHTVDETTASEYCAPGPAAPPDNKHIVCLRTKYNPGSTKTPGGKLGVYSHWAPNTTCWDGTTPQEFEFYDYTNNSAEKGNDYSSSTSAPGYLTALGSWGPAPWGFNASGLIGKELDPPLIGAGLKEAQATAQQQFCSKLNPCNA